MIGAGGQAGQGDAANLLKPALARGELRTIAATTWSEYKKYFEKDAALARRFQVVKVEEPSELAVHEVMMRGLVPALEKHHNVRILDEAVCRQRALSHRYLAGRQLPDKAVSILDTACARLSLGQNATIPPAIEDLTRQIDDLAVQKRILEREDRRRARPPGEAGRNCQAKGWSPKPSWQRLQERWEKESASWCGKIREMRDKLEGRHGKKRRQRPESRRLRPRAAATPARSSRATPAPAFGCEGASCRRSKPNLRQPCRARPADPGVRGCADCRRSAFRLDRHSGRQDAEGRNRHGARAGSTWQAGHRPGSRHGGISQRVQTSRASLDDPNKPVGVFMLVGPSGVGKTETALALATCSTAASTT
jgi:type VI secretion system protein VasG